MLGRGAEFAIFFQIPDVFVIMEENNGVHMQHPQAFLCVVIVFGSKEILIWPGQNFY